jgi:tyrosyl-tRNA synthetase
MKTDVDTVLKRGVENIVPNRKLLEKALKSGKKLNVYFGIDPTATQIHLGHAVPLRKTQEFAELGHNVTFLIGDFTALIGDTSDKESERPVLTYEQIKKNFQTYKSQAEKIVDFSKIKIVYNSSWLKKLNFSDIVKLCQHFSLGDFINRELMRNRLDQGSHIGLHEVLYPVMQGFDSYHLDCDIQIGGPDQIFNMQAGRTLQKHLRNKKSFVLATGYLEGTDGRKMSKTWGNAVWLNDPPDDMFGKIMSINDKLILQYFRLATNLPDNELSEIEKRLKNKEIPIKLKKILAHRVVSELHSDKAANLAQDNFESTFQKREPEFNEEIGNKGTLVETIAQLLKSKSEAKRLISEGAVDVNDKTMKDPASVLKKGDKIKIGKRKFVKVS